MEYRKLGRTDIEVSLLGLGSGGRSRLGQTYGSGQTEVNEVVRRALDLGVNIIDTAPGYADSEELLGRALAGVKRDSYVLCTKFQPVQGGVFQPPAALRESLERSLERLRSDHVEVAYLHGVHPQRFDAVVDRFLPELQRAQRDGLIRHIGITEIFQEDEDHRSLRDALALDVFDVMMVGHNLLSPSPAELVFPRAQQARVGLVVMCAVRGALLDPVRVRQLVREWKDAGLLAEDAVPDDDVLGGILGDLAGDVASAAYRFAADHPAVATVLTGTGSPAHLEQNAAAVAAGPLPADVVRRLYELFGPVRRAAGF
jgi:L-galactose dehydrogenase